MSLHPPNPWTELVKLHPDVEPGSLAETVLAIDLGIQVMDLAGTEDTYTERLSGKPLVSVLGLRP